MTIQIDPNSVFGEERVRPYQHYIEVGEYGSPSYKQFPLSLQKFYRKGGSITLSFNVDDSALSVLKSGATFGVGSDATHMDRILPLTTMRLDPRIVPTLLKTCEF